MAQKNIAGKMISLDKNGYLSDAAQWTKEVAAEIAKEEGIDTLTDDHWKVIDFLRLDTEKNGSSPTIRRLNKTGGIDTKLLYSLFPGGPLKKATRIAGLSKPSSCV